jgi:hypothetical protein
MNTKLRNAFIGIVLGVNALTATNSGMIAHDYIHNDVIGNPRLDNKLIFTFTTATLGSLAALAYPAIDWQSGTNRSYASRGDTPISVLSENTPNALKIPAGVIVSLVGAPGSAAGNFIGSVTGFFAPQN